MQAAKRVERGIDGDGSAWAALGSKVVEAIRAVLDVTNA